MIMPLAVYASDEDVALVAPADVVPLLPADQLVVGGIDGVFEPSDRWTLRSSSVDFAAAKLRRGHVVRLVGPAERFQPPGVLLGVAEVFADRVTLRRIGMEAGTGAPAAPAEGLIGVEFVATTLAPQLSQASRELDRLLGLDSPLEGDEALRDAVVRLVLSRRYALLAGDADAASSARARMLREEFCAILARFSTRIGHADGVVAPRFGTRVVR